MDIKNLTAEEKMKLLAGKNMWETEDLDGKLPSVYMTDGPVGLRKNANIYRWQEDGILGGDLPAIAYPSVEVLSQSWDPALAYEMGQCLSDDCAEQNVDVLLAPGVNIKRSPVCGRSFEYFSEDPYISGVFGREYIKGVQSGHVGATLKHYAANNNEIGRMDTSSNVDERTLWEIYLRAFEIAMEAEPWAVMCSYNYLNGVKMSHNAEYTKILRETLGLGEGLYMSDWGAVIDHVASVKSGLDLEMPFSEEHLKELKEAYAAGRVTDEELDRCAARVLAFQERCDRERKLHQTTHTIQQRRAMTQKIAENGIVLLKNNGVLPLKNGQSIALAEHKKHYFAGGGSSSVPPEQEPEKLLTVLQQAMPDSPIVYDENWWRDFYTNADGKDVSLVACGCRMAEGDDRANLYCERNTDRYVKAMAARNPNTVVILYGGGVVDMSAWIDDVAAVVYVGYPGQRGAQAIINILTGKVNPSGKLTETFGKTQADYPSEHTLYDGLNYNYTEGMDVGYRYFDKHPEKVRFPFGYGLSYTKFQYSGLSVTLDGHRCTARYTVSNVGQADGAEVSQVYVRAVDPAVEKPDKELRGFARTFLKAGESREVQVELDPRAFDHYDTGIHGWVTDAGSYEIVVAENAQSEKLRATVTVAG